MMGGYLTFQGIDGRGRWRRTPVEEALPVTMLPYDDRLEIPEGFRAKWSSCPITRSCTGCKANGRCCWAPTRSKPRAGAQVLAQLPAEQGGHPLLVAGEFGQGRSVAWTSDVGPHWLPNSFLVWPGYARLWLNLLSWVTKLS